MPCNCDYMEPNNKEVDLSKVYALLDELETGILSPQFGTGYDVGKHKIYNKGLSKEHLSQKTEELCNKLQKIKNVSKYSLELQMWWRDHQAADKARVEEQLKRLNLFKEKKRALAKLTEYERKLLKL